MRVTLRLGQGLLLDAFGSGRVHPLPLAPVSPDQHGLRGAVGPVGHLHHAHGTVPALHHHGMADAGGAGVIAGSGGRVVRPAVLRLVAH